MMLAARLSTVASTCSRGIVRSSCLNLGKPTPVSLVTRGFRDGGSRVARRIRFKETAIPSVKPLQIGQAAAAGGAVLGMGALCYYGLGLSNEVGAIDRIAIWPDHVRARIRDTYMYFGASGVAVAASAVAVFKSPAGQKFFALCSRHPIMSTVGIMACMIGSGQIMMSVPYTSGLGTKQAMWLINCGILGLAVAPLGALGGAIAIRAGWYTAGIVGGLSIISMCAPSEKFMNWGAPLGIGLGAVLAASIGSAFLPPTTALGLSLYSFSLYGGLLLFSAMLLYDTQKIIHKAENHPNYWNAPPFDPINASHRVVMDTLNIFVRLIQIFSMGGVKRK